MKNLHPSVELAEGVVVGTHELMLYGQILTGGIARHKVKVMGFPTGPDGQQHIHVRVCPQDEPWPLEHRES